MNKMVQNFNLDIFISGENIDLCIPTEDYAKNSSWYSWFNDFKTTRFLEQGIFPNTQKEQVDFFNSIKSQNRLSLIISDRETYIGTISLSSINLYKRTSEIAMLIGHESTKDFNGIIAIEAMALITQHAFEVIGLKRITAGSHDNLTKFHQKIEILGYRIDGYRRMGFIKGNEEANSVNLSINYIDYQKIVKTRGAYWDSSQNMRQRLMKKMSIIPFVVKVRELFEREGEKYYNEIFHL